MGKKYVTLLLCIIVTIYSYGQCAPDVTPPTITCTNVVADCQRGVGSLVPTTSDGCGSIVLQTFTLSGATVGSSTNTGINDASTVNFLAGITTVTYTIEDAAGNSASCSFTVTLNDYTQPIVICPEDVEVSNDPGQCNAYVDLYALGMFPTAFDNCSGVSTVPVGVPPGSLFPVGTTTVIWVITDLAGNFVTCTQKVTVIDVEPPTISCPPPITVSATSGQCTANVNVPLPITTDNCTITSITNNFNGGGADASGVYPLGTTTVTFQATASDGITVSCSIDVIVINTQDPEITLNGANPMTMEACGTYTEFGATGFDACAGDITGRIVIDATAVLTNVVGSYDVIYTVTNAAGQSATQIRTVNVVDTQAPSLSLNGPNPLTVGDCSPYIELGALAMDPCFGDISGTVVIDNSNVDTSTLGFYVVTYTLMDASGNAATPITRTVEVIDTNGPDIVLQGPNPQIIELCAPYAELGATAIDSCFDIDYTGDIVIDASAVNFGLVGSYPVTYNVMDNFGNSGVEVIRTIEIVDTVMPTITCPEDMVLETEVGSCSVIVNYELMVIDNCTGEIIVQTSGLPSGAAFPIGITTNTFELTDAEGNVASCSFEVTVNDSELPVARCQDITRALDPITGLVTISAADMDNGSSDHCSFTLSISPSIFDCSALGENEVTLIITDASGNIGSCTSIITITDVSESAQVSITSTATTICQSEQVIFTATPIDGGATPTYQWQINGSDVVGETGEAFTTTLLSDADVVTVVMTSSLSICATAQLSNEVVISVNDYNAPANAGPDMINIICTETTVTLAGSAVTGSGETGLWTVTSGQISGFSFSDVTSPTSTFSGDIGEVYTLTWTIDNPAPCLDTSASTTITFIGCNALDFDGVDDNISFRDHYNFGGDFTIEIWMKSDVTTGNIQTILSKREANNMVDGYDLRLVNNILSFNWDDDAALASPFPIAINRWYHVALTFEGGTYTLYVDGVVVNSSTGTLPLPNTVDFIVGAMDQTLVSPFRPLHYFDGGTDELRIWNRALSTEHIRRMMNQEIADNLGNVRGTVMQMDIAGLAWTDLEGYYQMNQISDIVSGSLTSSNGSGIDGVLKYMTTFQPDTAPIPYQTTADGFWADTNVWLHGAFQTIPNSLGIDGITPIDWNIVRTSHHIASGDINITVAGLDVASRTLTIANADANDGQSLRVMDYLILNGDLRLVGESQLLQDTGSIVDYAGAGVLRRDQQGSANLFNYNYWGSPVSFDGAAYAIGNVLYDGAVPVQWTTGHSAIPNTTPITLSSRWLYLYENYPENTYAAWNRINAAYPIAVGLGYIMKGSGAAGATQNYTFVGKPNNGVISTPITVGNESLVGNPYPSAIDADTFINDNSGSIQGALYFWEHYTSNATHVLADYQGGYSSYNLVGGNPAVSPPEVSGLGTPSKLPERYVPVAQGFMVVANAFGGSVVFENDQRVFVKEGVTGTLNNGSVFMRSATGDRPAAKNKTAVIKRIRLAFKTPHGATRPLLLGFVPNHLATDGFDYGYDAINTETLPNDMSWLIADERYVIQGIGDFDVTKKIPLGIFLKHAGNIEIKLTALENFDSDIPVFIYDALMDTYMKINNTDYHINLKADSYVNRFYLAFQPSETLSVIEDLFKSMTVQYLNKTQEIYIETPSAMDIEGIDLISVLGQKVKSWELEGQLEQRIIRVPVKGVSSGNYVLKIRTSTGVFSKKIIVNIN
ncbi:immunoglobulin-like domain-containing protein [Gelidibacter gilvus]|nr:immunoglobulin-like domain-containing protein [Gelidibacter gilvus]